jgi:uncharacterized protein YodC (DUF2158 family)
MDNNTFMIGEIVVLKNGGPNLIILDNRVNKSSACLCGWFDGKHEFHTEILPDESLVAARLDAADNGEDQAANRQCKKKRDANEHEAK